MMIVHVEMLPAKHEPLFQKEARDTGGTSTANNGRIMVQYEFSTREQAMAFRAKVQHRADVLSVGWITH